MNHAGAICLTLIALSLAPAVHAESCTNYGTQVFIDSDYHCFTECKNEGTLVWVGGSNCYADRLAGICRASTCVMTSAIRGGLA